MQDLRLVGVHDDGEHLLLSGTGGEMFQLPIDEALRVAASRTSAKAASGAAAAPIAMSPRDIQARIRSGSTAAEVAELSGIPLAKVQRYEGPVLAEREYVAQQARKVEVAAPAPGHDVYRSVFGDHPASLGDMVAHRLSAHGIEASTVEWDSWRRPDGSWNVVARFEAKPGGPAGIGEEPPAMWTFSPARKSLQNANRWAQQLSELEPLDGPVPARRLTAVSDRPFDFETDADAAARTATAQLQVVQQLSAAGTGIRRAAGHAAFPPRPAPRRGRRRRRRPRQAADQRRSRGPPAALRGPGGGPAEPEAADGRPTRPPEPDDREHATEPGGPPAPSPRRRRPARPPIRGNAAATAGPRSCPG